MIANDEIIMGQLKLNLSKQLFSVQGKNIDLMPLEYKLLHFFMTHPNKVYSRDQLLSYIWGVDSYINERTVDVQVKRLRSKLKPYGGVDRIKTIRSVGYLFTKDEN